MSTKPKSTSSKILGKRISKFQTDSLPVKKKAKTYRANYGLKGAQKMVTRYQDYLSDDALALVLQTLDPEENSKAVVRWPNQIGGTSILASKTVFEAEFANDDTSSVVVHPYLTNSITHTTHDIVVIPPVAVTQPGGVVESVQTDIKPHISQELKAGKDIPVFFSAPMNFGLNTVLYPTNAKDQIGNGTQVETIYWFGIRLSAAEVAVMDATIGGAVAGNLNHPVLALRTIVNSFADYSTGSTVVRFYGANQTLIATTTQSPAAGTSITLLNVLSVQQLYNAPSIPLVGGGRTYIIGFSQSVAAKRGIYGICSTTMYYNPVANANPQPWPGSEPGENFRFISLGNHAVHQVRSLTDADTVFQQAGQYCVIAQSLLMTSTSSSDNNSGTVASARMPGGKRVGGNIKDYAPDWYSFIGSLGYNSYDGALRNGTYTWYLGKDQNSYEFESVDGIQFDLQDENYMAGVAVGEANSSVRIKVFTLVAFTSSNAIYEQQVSPYVKDMPLLLQLLGLCNSSFENGTHGQQLKAHLKKYGRMVFDQAKKIAKDPNTYKTAASYIKKYGPTVASGLAALI